MKRLLLPAVALLLASCQVTTVDTPGGGAAATQDTSGVGLRDTLTLGAAASATFFGVEIGFLAVREDSRCPKDVECVWAGNAAAEISVGPADGRMGPTHQLVLNTGIEPRTGEALSTHVTLLEVQPEPVSTDPIPAEAYVVRLAVVRTGR